VQFLEALGVVGLEAAELLAFQGIKTLIRGGPISGGQATIIPVINPAAVD
jgi:hypothetical protein